MKAEMGAGVARVLRHTHSPIAVGFGIREIAQARELAVAADLVVIGSKLVETQAAITA